MRSSRRASDFCDAQAARHQIRLLLAIAGAVETGLVFATAEQVVVGHPEGRVKVPWRVGR